MSTHAVVEALRQAGEDFEWYPTTKRMVDAVQADLRARHHSRIDSILDIGAGDGRVLAWLNEGFDAKLYAIEKSAILQQQQPDAVVPVGTDFLEQDLMSLPVDVIFCNPPYSEFEAWASHIIRTAHAETLYLVLPQRWEDDPAIADALKRREAKAEVLHRGDFHDAERRARAVVHVIRVTFGGWGDDGYRSRKDDPFDRWFDEHIDTFDREQPVSGYEEKELSLARIRALDSIPAMVDQFLEDHARMEANYRAIFKLDAALLRELCVDKTSVREGLKKRMSGLKAVYWQGLFERLDVITARLTTKTKAHFLDRLTGQQGVAFTSSNAYAVVLWAIKAANQYFDRQVIDVYRALSTHDGVRNYVSNQRTWEKDGWRYNAEQFSHYALDYRIVLHHYQAIHNGDFGGWDYPGGLHQTAHETVDDLIAVFSNLGFPVRDVVSRSRRWRSGVWQDFRQSDGRVVFQVKAFLNGNLHLRIDQQAIKALNIEAGRLLGWLRTPAEAASELGYTPEEVAPVFGANHRLVSASVPMLGAATVEVAS